MKIPRIISRYGNEYIFVEKYPSFYLYKNMLTGVKETFKEDELKNNALVGKGTRKAWKDID